MNECSCMTCKKEILMLQQEIKKLQELVGYLHKQLRELINLI